MFLFDIALLMDHVNGVSYIFKAVCSKLFLLELLTDDSMGNTLVFSNTLRGLCDCSFPIEEFTKTQFTMIFSFPITVKIAQRQLFSGAVGLDLIDTVFSHGQLYVGLSRVTHPGKLKVCLSQNSNNQKRIWCILRP